jgi:hypothetical protein
MNKTLVIMLSVAMLLVLAGVWTWPHYQEWRLDRAAQSELLRQPVYALMREHEPRDFQALAHRGVRQFRQFPAQRSGHAPAGACVG